MAIHINHTNTEIKSDSGQPLKLNEKGVVKLGNGKYSTIINGQVSNNDIMIKGALRINDKTNTLQICDGKMWKNLGNTTEKNQIKWSILF